MLVSAIFAFLHFLSAFGLVSTVILERVLLKPKLSLAELKRLAKIDGLYGLSAISVLIVGFLRVYYFEKGSSYYFSNPIFLLKLTIFIIIGLLSIYPTIRIIKWSKLKADLSIEPAIYRKTIQVLNFELLLLVLLILAASLMAKGIMF